MVARCKGQEKLLVETGQGVHLQEVAQVEVHESPGGLGVPVEPCGLGLDWWLETWRRPHTAVRRCINQVLHLNQVHAQCVPHLPPEPPRCTCSQESSTGGGMAVLTVVVLMSPMMLRASRRA